MTRQPQEGEPEDAQPRRRSLIACGNLRAMNERSRIPRFEQQANPPAVYAAVLIASITTFLVFLLAQRTIIRGIVVPVEK